MVVTMEPNKSGEATSDEDDNDNQNETEQQEIPTGEKLLLPIQCPLVDTFVGDIKENLATSNM